MAVGKSKKGAKGKKKVADPFTKKDWYDIKAPALFKERQIGKTTVNRTQGNVLASDGLRGRTVICSYADLNKNEDLAHINVKLRIEEIQGRNCLTTFAGMAFTSDRVKSLVRKWQSLIECNVDVKTTDGYTVRLFAIAFTKRRHNQQCKTSYARASQRKQIRKKMTDIMRREASAVDLKDLYAKFVPNTIGNHIERECQGIYPLKDAFVRKLKIVKAPRFDSQKLNDLHGDAGKATIVAEDPKKGKKLPRQEQPEPEQQQQKS